VLGEHSLEILRELGLAEESIDALFAEGIAHGPQAVAPAKTDVV
jgi:hypothetical protein